jgi:YHS domain-containing protein
MNIKRVWILAMLGVLGAVALWGCNQAAEEPAETTPPADSTSSTAPEQPAPEPTTGNATAEPVAYTNDKGELLCPVMGTVIESKEKAVGYQDYEGVRYYFCCGGCPDQFKKDPAKYAKKPAHTEGEHSDANHAGSGESGS